MIQQRDYNLKLRMLDGTGQPTAVEDDVPSLEVASPPEFGGPGAANGVRAVVVVSVSGCPMTTFQAIASISKLELVDYSDRPNGHMDATSRACSA